MPGLAGDGVAETAQARIAGFVAGDALEDADACLAAGRLHRVLAGELAAFVVVGADERLRLHARVRRRLRVDARVDDDDRHAGVSCFDERRHDLARAARRDAERLDAGLNQVLDDLHLLLDVDLALGGLHLQRDAEPIGRLLRAAAHVDEERMVERLEHERDRRLVGRLRSRAVAGRPTAASSNERRR